MPLPGKTSLPPASARCRPSPRQRARSHCRGRYRLRPGCSWIACACGGFALTCRLGVLLSGASIDGSLWYGDLPAPDGARDDRHSRTFSWRARRRPQHLEETHPRGAVLCVLMAVVTVADRVALALIRSSTPVSHPSPCLGLSRTVVAPVRRVATPRRVGCLGCTPAPVGAGSLSRPPSVVAIGAEADAAVSAMSPAQRRLIDRVPVAI